jgi:4-hydroxy-4-methyl-2-oxoglutarate aldolase
MDKVFRSPERPHPELVEVARSIGVSTIFTGLPEPMGRSRTIPASALRRITGSETVAGYAVTAWNPPGTNSLVRSALEVTQPGDVVVAVCPTDEAALWGELASAWAKARGAAGAVIDGAVRDVRAVDDLGLSVWGRSVDPRRALKSGSGYVNAPVLVRGVRVNPGDLVVADDDGVIVLAQDILEDAIDLALKRQDVEKVTLDYAVRGATDPRLVELTGDGVVAVDRTWDEV